jgi:hypothetical protein
MSILLDYTGWKKFYEAADAIGKFKDENGITYQLNFKDQSAFDEFISARPTSQQLPPATLLPWVTKYNDDTQNNQRVAASNKWSIDKQNLVSSLFASLAYIGTMPNKITEDYSIDEAIKILSAFNSATQGKFNAQNAKIKPAFALDILTNDASYKDAQGKSYWTKLNIKDKNDPSGKTFISPWKQFLKDSVIPLLSEKQNLVLTAPGKPTSQTNSH